MKPTAPLVLFCLSGLAGLSSAPAAAQQAELARSRNCMACHKVDARGLGPSFREVANRYSGDAGAAARLARKVREGGTGVWGRTVMPANPQVSEADADTLVRWVLSQKSP